MITGVSDALCVPFVWRPNKRAPYVTLKIGARRVQLSYRAPITMSFKFDFDIDDIDEDLDTTPQVPESQSPETKEESHPLVPSQEHPIDQFVRRPPLM